MNSKRDFDRAVDQWLDEGSDATPPEVIDAVLLAVRSTPQERDFRVPWRTTSMTSYLRVAAILALAVIASTAAIFTFGPGRSGSGGTNATPSPSPALLARGNIDIRDWNLVEFEAYQDGSDVSGLLTARRRDATSDYMRVDLRCARTSEDGLIVIGGYEAALADRPGGGFAAIALQRGSPVKAQIWAYGASIPGAQTTDCVANADAWLRQIRNTEDSLRDDFEGTVEFGQSEAELSVEPSPKADLPVGPHVMVSIVGLNEDRVAVTIPAPGWSAEPDEGSLTKGLAGDDRVTVVTVPGDHYRVPRDICNWQTGSDPDPGYRFAGTVDELVAYLTEQTYDTPEGLLTRDLSSPVDITLDGHPGQSITGAVPGSDPDGCDEQRFCSLTDRDGGSCLLAHDEPNALLTLWITAPPARNPALWVVAASYWPTTSSELFAEMNAIVDSMTVAID